MSEDLEQKMSALVERFRQQLPAEVVTEALDLVDHREWGVALELVCEMLFEESAKLGTEDIGVLRDTAQLMGLGPDTWKALVPLAQ